jgi:hypothetical protein
VLTLPSVPLSPTGSYRRLTMRTPKDDAIKTFTGVYGIAAALAEDLWNRGARTVEDLKRDPVKYKLNDAQIIGLEYYEDLLQRFVAVFLPFLFID